MRVQEVVVGTRIRTIGSLAAALVVSLVSCAQSDDNGPANKTRMRLLSIATVLEDYKAKQGRYPTDSEGLNAAAELAGLHDASERALVRDGWGAPFVYKNGSPPAVYSTGPNGRDDGGTQDDVTLSSVDTGK